MRSLRHTILSTPSMWLAAALIWLAKNRGSHDATVRRDGVRMTCGTRPGQGAFCAIGGLSYEPELRWVLARLNTGDMFIDVGANIGIYSIHGARKVGPSGCVLAIEPSPNAAAILRRNVVQNGLGGVVQAIEAAASHTAGRLYLSGDTTRWNALQLKPSPPGEDVRVITIDGLLNQATHGGRVAVLKIDAESVEYDVLRGASATISTHRPAVVFESIFQRTGESAAAWLVAQNYRLMCIDPQSGSTAEVQPDDNDGTVNLVAIPREIDRG